MSRSTNPPPLQEIEVVTSLILLPEETGRSATEEAKKIAHVDIQRLSEEEVNAH
jgi:hypothetical protein